MKRRLTGFVAAGMLALAAPAFAAMEVHIEGAVAHPGTVLLKDSARLSDAALAAKVRADAYFLGAAWLRPSLVTQQTREKAGVLFDLGVLHRQALARGDMALAQTARHMQQWISALPVTGRTPALLAPRVVEATPAQNWPVAPGDTLFYPERPVTVRVVGAVTQPCTLPIDPLQDARHYLDACHADHAADRDWAWVIQPDGHAFKVGVALWNLSKPLPVAPGAVIYLPLRPRLVDRIDPDFNHDIAAFLATQTLPGATP